MHVALAIFIVAVVSFVAGAVYGKKLAAKAKNEADKLIDSARRHL